MAFLQALKVCLSLSPYAKKQHNTLQLTKLGKQAMGQHRALRFRQVLQDYTLRFNWAYLDDTQTQAGQFGWAFSLYLVDRYGSEWRNTDFYAAKVQQAFPHLREPIPSGRLSGYWLEFERVYRWRFVQQFNSWFGLLSLQKEPQRGYYPDPLLMKKTALLNQLSSLRVSQKKQRGLQKVCLKLIGFHSGQDSYNCSYMSHELISPVRISS